MRTSLFLSGLFAVSLFGTVALAEKPHTDKPVREPKALHVLRQHGDVLDKQHKSDKPSARVAQEQRQVRHARSPIDKGASRINCAENDAGCGSVSRAKDPGAVQVAGDRNANRSVRWPGFMDKILGTDRMVCNEADECHMGHAAVNRAWSNHAARNAGASGAKGPMAKQAFVPREMKQASSERMACNEGDQCMMSSKGAKKLWAYEAIKAGTWKPADKDARDARAIKLQEDKNKK